MWRKSIEKYQIQGFVVGSSNKLLLLHVIEGNNLHLRGYCAIPLSDITSFKADKTFITRALQLQGKKPIVPAGIDLTDRRELLESAQQKYPLLNVHTEKIAPDRCFIGRIVKQKTRCITLQTINMKGQWASERRFAFKDITRLEFDTGYVNALSDVIFLG